MIQDRNEFRDYAVKLSIPLLEQTAKRREEQIVTEVNDDQGYFVSWFEGFCRMLWAVSPLIRNRECRSFCLNGKETSISAWIRETLCEGMDPESPYSWVRDPSKLEDNGYVNQMKTELCSLLTGMYIAREDLWEPLGKEVQEKIADWIFDITKRAFLHCWANNHYWFCVLNFLILKKLGFPFPETDKYMEEGLNKLNHMYVGNGWYQDGEFGRFDYYNPWAFHTYPMLFNWITGDDPEYAEYRQLFRSRTEQFLQQYYYWFDETGANIPFGRSLTYRFAAGVTFPAAVLGGCQINYGAARYAMLRNMEYYQNQKNLKDTEILPPGFLYNNTNVIENYISDNSVYWCLKPFLALLLDEKHPFWNATSETLPIEKGNYFRRCDNPNIHILLEGDHESGVTLYNNENHYYQHGEKRNFFNDLGCTYSKFAYNSRSGFGMSTIDNMSLDNMISLITPDRTMWSHRFGIMESGEKNGVYSSMHYPFANDRDTVIHTWMIPLTNGQHIRIHRVILSQPYYIGEGGFSVPLYTDHKTIETDGRGIRVASTDQQSELAVLYSTVPLNFHFRGIQPGYHLYAPMAGYPYYESNDVCNPGEYIIASWFHTGNTASSPSKPAITAARTQNILQINAGGTTYNIDLSQ